MAVSQVEMLKNPCKVTTWNNFVASQPPSSAPATPITHVMTRPCDLLPGISRLASRPAPRPRTIHATIPITGLLYRDKADGRSGAGSRPGGLAPPWLRDTSPSYFSVTLQSTGQSRRRKEPETANAITQTEDRPAARTLTAWCGCSAAGSHLREGDATGGDDQDAAGDHHQPHASAQRRSSPSPWPEPAAGRPTGACSRCRSARHRHDRGRGDGHHSARLRRAHRARTADGARDRTQPADRTADGGGSRLMTVLRPRRGVSASAGPRAHPLATPRGRDHTDTVNPVHDAVPPVTGDTLQDARTANRTVGYRVLVASRQVQHALLPDVIRCPARRAALRAAWRSSLVVPPQIPSGMISRAYDRQFSRTVQPRQTVFAASA